MDRAAKRLQSGWHESGDVHFNALVSLRRRPI
jgi:hypothetical protein